jgi:hypothetical protein
MKLRHACLACQREARGTPYALWQARAVTPPINQTLLLLLLSNAPLILGMLPHCHGPPPPPSASSVDPAWRTLQLALCVCMPAITCVNLPGVVLSKTGSPPASATGPRASNTPQRENPNQHDRQLSPHETHCAVALGVSACSPYPGLKRV